MIELQRIYDYKFGKTIETSDMFGKDEERILLVRSRRKRIVLLRYLKFELL